jgi:hypothetical protein
MNDQHLLPPHLLRGMAIRMAEPHTTGTFTDAETLLALLRPRLHPRRPGRPRYGLCHAPLVLPDLLAFEIIHCSRFRPGAAAGRVVSGGNCLRLLFLFGGGHAGTQWERGCHHQ